MHEVLKATFLPLPTTKSSFLIRHKELQILAEKRVVFKPNPPIQRKRPGGGKRKCPGKANRWERSGCWRCKDAAGCTPGKTHSPAVQLGAADGEASSRDMAAAILPGCIHTHQNSTFTPTAGQVKALEGVPRDTDDVWKDWLTTAG